MTVNWLQSGGPLDNALWYRLGGEPWRKRTGSMARLKPSNHWVTRVGLNDLEPETTYHFSIGEKPPEDDARVFSFRTMPRTLNRPIRFVAGGDMLGRPEILDAMNRQASRFDPDFALLGGDLAYTNNKNGAKSWRRFFNSWSTHMRGADGRLIPMVVGIGNHEVSRKAGLSRTEAASEFFTLFEMPADHARHVVDVGDYLSLVMLDTGNTEPIEGAQTVWLGEVLAERRNTRFVFPAYHFPAYGTAKTEKQGGLPNEHAKAVVIRENWLPLFERHGVTAIFEHDHHAYKRSHPLRGNVRDDENGLLYLGDGAWGVEPRKIRPVADYWYLARAESVRHHFTVTLLPAGSVEIQAINIDGHVFDRVDLKSSRTRPESPPVSE